MHRSHAATAPLMDIRTGGCSAWQLPPDATCARIARSLVRDTLTALDLPDDLTYTATTLVSELATNAFQHAPGSAPPAATGSAPSAQSPANGLPELWLYVRQHPAPQLVMTVFDTHRHWNRRPGPRAFLPESGRGLEIVTTLSCAWGVHPSRPRRQGPCEVRGKAVWAAVRLPDGHLPDGRRPGQGRPAATRHPTPYEAITALRELLTARGITRVQRADNGLTSVLCLRPELTVWADACFRWRDGGSGGYLRRPFDDVVDVAEHLIHRYEELDLPFPWTATPTEAATETATATAARTDTSGPTPCKGANP
jgi:hypothetical protein